MASFPLLETNSLTQEDADRTSQYRARAQIAELEESVESLDAFYEGLKMQALIAPFDELHLPRIVQLIGKTNQFNMTTRRYQHEEVKAFARNEECVHFYLRLRDRFTDHGLVGILIACRKGDILDIDTWLMSCRVIGRTVEHEMLKYLSQRAEDLGCRFLQGTYIRTKKNGLVKDLFADFGFRPSSQENGDSKWIYDLKEQGLIQNGFIEVVDRWGEL